MESLSGKSKIRYSEGDEVEVALAGDIYNVITGKICGFASSQILDHWIIQLDKKLANLEYSCIVQQHTFIRRKGSDTPFLCEIIIG